MTRVIKNKKLLLDETGTLRYQSNKNYVSCGKSHVGNAIMTTGYNTLECTEAHRIVLENCQINEIRITGNE